MDCVHKDLNLPALQPKYEEATELHLENTGASWQLHFHDPHISSLTGGPLDYEYKVSMDSSKIVKVFVTGGKIDC